MIVLGVFFEFPVFLFDFVGDFQVFTGLNVSLGEGQRSKTSHSRRFEEVPGKSLEGSIGIRKFWSMSSKSQRISIGIFRFSYNVIQASMYFYMNPLVFVACRLNIDVFL